MHFDKLNFIKEREPLSLVIVNVLKSALRVHLTRKLNPELKEVNLVLNVSPFKEEHMGSANRITKVH